MTQKDPVRIGIVGLGRAGWAMHVRELRPLDGFRIVAGCDTIPERVEQLAQEFDAKGYSRYEDLLNDGNVELVAIATRSDTHAEIGVAALEAGKHVVLEKPIVVNLDEADRLVEADKRAAGQLLVRQNMRHNPAFLHVQEIIESGILGEVFEIKLCRHSFNRRNDWQTMKEFGGGQLNNWGPHIIDHALMFLGGQVENVYGELKRVVCAGDADDHVKIILQGRSGLLVEIEISGGVALGEPHYRVMGTRGTLVCDSKEVTVRRYDPSEALPLDLHPESPPQDHPYGNPETLPWQEETFPVAPSRPTPAFYELVYTTLREGEPFPITPDQARQVVWVTDQVRKSATF